MCTCGGERSVRLGLRTQNDVAKYLFNAAELLLDNEPTLRYTTHKAWYVDLDCYSWIIIYDVTETPHSNPPQVAAIQL